ncbi:MAG: phosphatidylserine/phosphatidylglycerophosphate/cardiolipin synthase family protein [Gammaproteobacteria bacterium]|nr:phosphatidylserine/phosphatidylglycerophosphate/cardiolipin synthase family protein [Gammaproteobacteria bacterium]
MRTTSAAMIAGSGAGKLPHGLILNMLSIAAAILLLATLLPGCANIPINPAQIDAGADSKALPMIALEGYRGPDNFFVKYRIGDRVSYAGGNWRNRLELIDPPLTPPSNYATPSLVPMEYHRETPWESLPQVLVEVPILGIEQWQLLRNRLLRAVVPDDGKGVVVDFGYTEYFLFYDENGEFQATRLTDKPTDYQVHTMLRFDEFMRRGRPILEAYLEEHGITETEFVFNTGDTGWYSLPFLYVNTNRHLLVFIRHEPQQAVAVTSVPGLKTGQAFGHVMRSHLTDLLLRPVSSLYRLFFVVTDTTVATLRLDWTTALVDKPVPELSKAPPMDLQSWESELDKISNHSKSTGTVDFLVDGEAFFTRFIDSVTRAEHSVHLQTYIFDNDDFAVRIGELLKRRSNEGIDVKILFDGLGTIGGTMSDSESLPEHHEPPASVHWFLEADSQIAVRQKANPWFTGDHIKSTIIDQQTAYVGGMNIGREYRYDWHDLMMELRGPVVNTLAREFRTSWMHSGPLGDLGYVISKTTPTVKATTDDRPSLRVLLTAPGNYEIYNAQLEAIKRAQSYIYVQNAYFTDDRLLRELVMARRRGVDVRVIIPMETDHGPITRSNVLAANVMLQHGIRVYVYPGFSHVKAAIYDGWVCVGSANFDRLSLRINRELNIASSDPTVAGQLLESLFVPDFLGSPELTEPIPERWIDHLVEIVGDYVY